MPRSGAPPYARARPGLADRHGEALEMAFGVRDAPDPHHPEFRRADDVRPFEPRRPVYVPCGWGR